MTIVLQRSTNKGKKWTVILENQKRVHFGALGYEDYTQHHDHKRRESYISRHRNDGTTPDTAGFWSRELLWSKPSLSEAIKHVESLLGKKITLKQ